MSVSPLRAAVIEPVGDHGGMNYFDFGLCEGLAAAKVEVVLHTCQRTPVEAGLPFVVEDRFSAAFAPGPRWRRGWAFVKGCLGAIISARRSGARIVHFHFFQIGLLQILQVVMSRLLGLRVVISAHDVEPFDARARAGVLDRWTYGLANGVIAHNGVSRRELVNKIEVEPERISVVRLGMHVEPEDRLMLRSEARRRLALSDDEFVVLFFGQIKDVKGLDILIDAMAALRERASTPVRLVIAGRPWRRGFEEFQEQITRLGLDDVTSLHIRYIDDADVEAFYRCADIVALPYRRIYQSAVLLMAMRYRVPLIASNLEGMTEIVEHHRNGLLFESGSSQSLTDGLHWAHGNRDELSQMCDRATDFLRAECSWSRVGADTAALYGKLNRARD